MKRIFLVIICLGIISLPLVAESPQDSFSGDFAFRIATDFSDVVDGVDEEIDIYFQTEIGEVTTFQLGIEDISTTDELEVEPIVVDKIVVVQDLSSLLGDNVSFKIAFGKTYLDPQELHQITDYEVMDDFSNSATLASLQLEMGSGALTYVVWFPLAALDTFISEGVDFGAEVSYDGAKIDLAAAYILESETDTTSRDLYGTIVSSAALSGENSTTGIAFSSDFDSETYSAGASFEYDLTPITVGFAYGLNDFASPLSSSFIGCTVNYALNDLFIPYAGFKVGNFSDVTYGVTGGFKCKIDSVTYTLAGNYNYVYNSWEPTEGDDLDTTSVDEGTPVFVDTYYFVFAIEVDL